MKPIQSVNTWHAEEWNAESICKNYFSSPAQNWTECSVCVCFSTNHDWLFAVWLFWRSSPHSWVCRTSGWLWTWIECWPALTSPNRSDLQTHITNGFNYLLKGENVLCFLATSSNKVTVKVFSRWTWCVLKLGDTRILWSPWFLKHIHKLLFQNAVADAIEVVCVPYIKTLVKSVSISVHYIREFHLQLWPIVQVKI